jgi:tetratricopeptide (TPR) repeat protein
MSRRRYIAAVIASSCVALGAVTVETVASAVAASTASTPTAPQQLVHQYPIGPQKLCCNGQTGASTTTGSRTPAQPTPPSAGTSASGSARTTAKPAAHGGSAGVPVVLLIGFGILALIIIAAATSVYRTRRRPAPALDRRFASPAPDSNGAAAGASRAADVATPDAEPAWDRASVPPGAASDADEQEFRRLDQSGDAGGAFNLGVVLHQRGDATGAMAAYERAEQRGDPDAAFNLGVLLYDAGDLDGAEAAWQRSAGRGHVRAAANLLFLSRRRRDLERGTATQSEAPELAGFEELSYRRADESGTASGAFNLGAMLHQQGDTAGAVAAYERAERRGDPDAAFNLGVLLYDAGDLDGAEAAWRRSAGRGHDRAGKNLEFLLRHRRELETAGVAGDEGDER